MTPACAACRPRMRRDAAAHNDRSGAARPHVTEPALHRQAARRPFCPGHLRHLAWCRLSMYSTIGRVPGWTGANGPRRECMSRSSPACSCLDRRAAAAPLGGRRTPCRFLARQADRRQAGQCLAGSGDQVGLSRWALRHHAA